jgi:ribosomal protein L22
MADRKGGKGSPGDLGTKQDAPSDRADADKAEAAAAQARQEVTESEAAQVASTPPPGVKETAPSEPEAEGTAAATTGVDKAAADVLAPDGVEELQKPKPRRSRKKADADAEAAADAPAEDAEAKPARKRGSRGGSGRARKPAEPKADAPPKEQARSRRQGARTNGTAPVVRAQARYVRTSARKARLVCDHIRGKSVDEARAILAYTPRAVARDWAKLLESAVANAEHNHELVGDDLRVLAAFADEGPTLKRFRPRAMGRATRIRKRTSHLTITLTPKES